MKIVVQKYGGTSVNTKKKREKIIVNAKEALLEGMSPVIVVSAMGRYPDPYSTDTLLSLLPDVNDTDVRSRDMLSSIGEIISAVIVSEELRHTGMNSVALNGGQAGILTDDSFGEGEILSIDTKLLMKYIKSGIIPVVAGFQGTSENGNVLTLGRGGSDITAAALGGALKAEMVEIFTDVDGVMTADPNVVKSAELIDAIEYDDVFRLAEYGAKVIHPRAISHAMSANVPVAVLNINNKRNAQHTIISDAGDIPRGKSAFSAVTSIDKCSQVEITFSDMKKEDTMFKLLADNSISLDMINIFADRKIFIISSDMDSRIKDIINDLNLEYTVRSGFSKITVVGSYIVGVPGIIAKIIAALYSNEIPVFQSSDSSNTISVLVQSDKSQQAVNILHDALIINR